MLKYLIYIPAFSLLLIPGVSKAADLFGVITDEYGKPLPFATLYVMNATHGTTSNAEGEYRLALSPGEVTMVYQFMGYQRQEIRLKVDHRNVLLNVVMQPETLKLKEVEILAGGEDPALEVMRQAIQKRKHHLEEVEAYSCNMYVKGVQNLTERPDKLLGMNVPIDTGMVYLSESISELNVKRPNQVKEIVVSSKVSGSQSTLSFNQGSQMLHSFYQNLLKIEGVSERGFVSPLANNALLYYDYKLEGVKQEGNLLINKIRIIPKRSNDPVFQGVIYIVEDLWRIQSVELSLTKGHQVEFIDQLTINQRYTTTKEGVWMMFSQQYSFDVSAFGFIGKGYFIGVQTDYQIQQQGDDPLFDERFFNNELLSISLEAKEQTEQFWNQKRPIPLSRLEADDYSLKDSLSLILGSKDYKDSMDVKLNRFNPESLLIGGYLYRNTYKETYYRFQPLYNIIQYNTVEGLVIDLKSTITKEKGGVWKYQLIPNLRYGFAGKNFYGKLRIAMQFDAYKKERSYLEGGRFVSQFNQDEPIVPVINTFETLLRRSNLMKLYEKRYAKWFYTKELVNGLRLRGSLAYEDRMQLYNTTSHSFGWPDSRPFTTNEPVLRSGYDASFDTNQSLRLSLGLTVNIAQRYISRPNMKISQKSKYPTFQLTYAKGIPGLSSDVDYDVGSIEIYQSLDAGLWGAMDYTLELGRFLNAKKMYVMDYHHFNTSEALFASFARQSYLLLPSYLWSTNSSWLGIHVTHHFNGFVMNKLPLLRKSRAQMVVNLNALSTSDAPFYMEMSVGLEHIFKIGRIDYVRQIGVQHLGVATHGLRLGIGF